MVENTEGQREKPVSKRDWRRIQRAREKKRLVEETEGQYEKEIGVGYRGTDIKIDCRRIQRASKKMRLGIWKARGNKRLVDTEGHNGELEGNR